MLVLESQSNLFKGKNSTGKKFLPHISSVVDRTTQLYTLIQALWARESWVWPCSKCIFKFEKFINLLDLFPILFLTSLFYALKKEVYSFLNWKSNILFLE